MYLKFRENIKLKLFKPSLRRGILVAIIVSLLALFIPNMDNVRAVFKGAQALYVLWRFERDVLRTTRVGQYYEGLLFKHAQEVGNLLSRDKDNTKKNFSKLGMQTIPLLESYLNGEGDTAIITAESMDILGSILNGLHATGSPSLQADIQEQFNRFPLDNFVGMSMNDAYAYVLANFSGAIPEPAIVMGTNRKWAYYIYKGVYFEYPSNWYVQEVNLQEENKNVIMIIPSSEKPQSMECRMAYGWSNYQRPI